MWQKLSAGGGVSNFTVTGPPAAASDSTVWGLSPTAFAALWVLLVLVVLAFCCVACMYWSWRSKEVQGVAGQSRIDERHVNELWDEHQRPGAKPQVKKQRAGVVAVDAPMPRAAELQPRELPTDAEAGAGQPPLALLPPEAAVLQQGLLLPPGALASVGGDEMLPRAGAGGDPEVDDKGEVESQPAAAGDVVLEGLLGFVGAAVGPALLGRGRGGSAQGRGGGGGGRNPRAREAAAPGGGGHVPRPWELHPAGGLGPIGESRSAQPSLPSSHRGWARPRDGGGGSGGGSSYDSYSYTYGTGTGSGSDAGGSRAAELTGGVGWSSRTSGSGSRRLRRGAQGGAPKAGSARMRLSAIDDVDDERGGGDADSRGI